MSFCTVINCMDGRVQLPVIEYLKNKFEADFVDTITEAGPVAILAEKKDSELADSILKRVDISVNKHKSVGIAVVAQTIWVDREVLGVPKNPWVRVEVKTMSTPRAEVVEV